MSSLLYDLFHKTAVKQADHAAILGPVRYAITYGELDRMISDTSEWLRQTGVKEGDCVGLHYPSGSQYIILNYALWRCGASVVPIATELASVEKTEIFRQIALNFVISGRGRLTFADPHRCGDPAPVAEDAFITALASPCDQPPEFDAIDTAFIRFTSGTTGLSKGVVLSHRTVLERIEAANEALHIGSDDRVLWLLSMAYHFTVSIVSYLTYGATIVLPDNHFASAVIAACRRHQATLIYASPTHWGILAAYPTPSPLESLRLAISTTTSLDIPVADKFRKNYGPPLTQALGIIEVGLPCINLDFAETKPDSVGRVLPAYELRLVDVGLGDSLKEIYVRGKGMFDAYYRPWRPRGQIVNDGWFATGDIGELDSDGCLYIRGRRKDVISIMGMKFFPQEVEAVLGSHPAVAAAVVFTEHDSRRGEAVHAHVVCKAGTSSPALRDDLRTWCKARLAFYKVPEVIEFVDALAQTASGKVLHPQPQGVEA